jgi:hypothetical protein
MAGHAAEFVYSEPPVAQPGGSAMASNRYRLIINMTWRKTEEFETDETFTGEPTHLEKLLVYDAARAMVQAKYGTPDDMRVVVATDDTPVLFVVDKAYVDQVEQVNHLHENADCKESELAPL